jgi:hypothetical protein
LSNKERDCVFFERFVEYKYIVHPTMIWGSL